MAIQSQIRWKQGDYIKLGRAVSEFNKKINKLKAEENKLYLPEEYNYKNLKENITTRNELNRIINSLKRFQKEGAEDLYKTQAGEEITKWEYQELKMQNRIATSRLQKELKDIQKTKVGKPYRTQREIEIEAQIGNLKKFENLTKSEFKKLKSRIRNAGVTDYNMKKAIVFQNNYLNEMEKYSHFANYNILMKKLNSFKNPINFYEFLKDKNELIVDLTYQSDENFRQEEFNRFVEEITGEQLEDSISKEEDF